MNSLNIHAALCSEPRVLHYTQTSNGAVNGFIEFMSPLFLHAWHPTYAADPTLIKNLPTILCLPVKTLFSELRLKHIDIWILDIEGAELSALEGVDWKEVSISAIVVECDGRDGEKDKQKVELLKKQDYLCQKVSKLSKLGHYNY